MARSVVIILMKVAVVLVDELYNFSEAFFTIED